MLYRLPHVLVQIRKELTLLRAVRKLEVFFRTYPEDPAEVLNMMVAAKRNPSPLDT